MHWIKHFMEVNGIGQLSRFHCIINWDFILCPQSAANIWNFWWAWKLVLFNAMQFFIRADGSHKYQVWVNWWPFLWNQKLEALNNKMKYSFILKLVLAHCVYIRTAIQYSWPYENITCQWPENSPTLRTI